MGVDYTPILGIGLEFDSRSEIREFLEDQGVISEKDHEEISEDGIIEFMSGHSSKLDVDCLNYYTGDYYWVGFKVYPRNLETLPDEIQSAGYKWEQLFPSVKPDVVYTVQVS
jgi:hypothetical protein